MLDGDYVIAGEETDFSLLSPLLSEHAKNHSIRLLRLASESCPSRAWWRTQLCGAAAVLRVGSPQLGAKAALPGVILRASDGRLVPAGWLPRETDRVAEYAFGAAFSIAERRASSHGPILLLAQREERALSLADELWELLKTDPPQCFRWTAERVIKQTLQRSLGIGAAAAIYVGHGYAWGWAGYSGFSSADIRAVEKPLGAVLSLCCDTFTRTGWMLSFSEELVLCRAALSALGATHGTLNCRNRAFAARICRSLAESRAGTIGALLRDVYRNDAGRFLTHYRLCGDPLAPLTGTPDAASRALQVPAPAPDDPPPPLSPDLWYG
jgi:hypothetical protein